MENAELDRPYHDGTINDVTRRRIQRSIWSTPGWVKDRKAP